MLRVSATKAQIDPEQADPSRMVFLIERHLAPPVASLGDFARGRSRAAAPMDDGDGRREADEPAALADGRAEVDVFCVHEVTLVEKPDGFGFAAADE